MIELEDGGLEGVGGDLTKEVEELWRHTELLLILPLHGRVGRFARAGTTTTVASAAAWSHVKQE